MLKSLEKGTSILSVNYASDWHLALPFWGTTSRGTPVLLGHPRTLQTGRAAGGATFLPAAPAHEQHSGTFPLVTVVWSNHSIAHNKSRLCSIMKWSHATNGKVHLLSSVVGSLRWKKERILWQDRAVSFFFFFPNIFRSMCLILNENCLTELISHSRSCGPSTTFW